MERFDVIRDYCEVNSLTQINNSWLQTAGQSLGVTPQAGDDYEQRVFMAILTAAGGGTPSRIESPDGNTYVEAFDTGVDISTPGEILIEAGTTMGIRATDVISFANNGETTRVLIDNDILSLKSQNFIVLEDYSTFYGGNDGGFNFNTPRLYLGNANVGEDDYSWALGSGGGAQIYYDATDVQLLNSTGNILVTTNGGDINMSVPGVGAIILASNTEISTVNDIYLAPGASRYIYPQSLQTFANDAAAGVGGVPQGAMYLRTTGELAVKL